MSKGNVYGVKLSAEQVIVTWIAESITVTLFVGTVNDEDGTFDGDSVQLGRDQLNSLIGLLQAGRDAVCEPDR